MIGTHRSGPNHDGPLTTADFVLRSVQISICVPSSTTRFGGIPKYCVALIAFRDMKMKSFFRHLHIGALP
jgi:hypothetical protein